MADFINSEVKNKIDKLIEASRSTKRPFPHTLLISGSHEANRSVACYISQKMESKIREAQGSTLKRAGDLAGVLTNLESGDILFIDEISKVSRLVEEYLYPAMEDFSIDVMIDVGPNARSVQVNIPPFTVVASIVEENSLSKKLAGCFLCTYRLDSCEEGELKGMFQKEFKKNSIDCDNDVLDLLVEKSDKNLTDGMALLKKIIKYNRLKNGAGSSHLDRGALDECFKMIGYLPIGGTGSAQERMISDEVKREVWRRDKGKCIGCGSNERLEYDHIIPFSKGGSNTARNIQLLCEMCNRKKSDEI